MDKTLLKKIGLSDKEIKVYLTLLEYGAISVRSLAELANLNRGTTYDILKKLQGIGIVSYYHQNTKQNFVAEDPEKIIKLVEAEEEKLKNVKEKLNKMIPELKSLQDKGGNKATTKFYEGRNGIKLILEDLLNIMENIKDKEYYIYSATNASDDINNAFPDFTKKRIMKKIKVKAISLAEGGKTHGFDERKWLGTHEESATFIMIYPGKCAFISRDSKREPIGVLIENQAIYITQKIIFDNLWLLLSKK